MGWLEGRTRPFGSWWALVGALAAILWWCSSPSGCATGASASDSDDDGTTPTTTAHGGAGGAGGTTSTGTGLTGGSTTTSSSTGDGGQGGWPCEEQPCKLTLPQCGCPPGEKCTLAATGRTCVTDGTTGPGEQCVSGCQAGYMCLAYVGPPSTCHKFCADDNDCVLPGGQCVLEVTEGIYTESICSENCDPITSTGCPVAGMKCEIGIFTNPQVIFTLCIPAGSGTYGAACADISDCAVGYSCFTVNSVNQCLQWCNLNNPVCSVGSCGPIDPPILVGSIEYGACG